MTSGAILAGAIAALCIALVALFAVQTHRAFRRRARRLQWLRESQETGPSLLPDLQWMQGSVSPERANRIISAAEEAAEEVVASGTSGINPYPASTREYVLWETSYLSRLSDFADLEPEKASQH